MSNCPCCNKPITGKITNKLTCSDPKCESLVGYYQTYKQRMNWYREEQSNVSREAAKELFLKDFLDIIEDMDESLKMLGINRIMSDNRAL